jgi:hypothetical protein
MSESVERFKRRIRRRGKYGAWTLLAVGHIGQVVPTGVVLCLPLATTLPACASPFAVTATKKARLPMLTTRSPKLPNPFRPEKAASAER